MQIGFPLNLKKMSTKRILLNTLLVAAVCSGNVSAFSPMNNVARRGQLYMSQNSNRPNFLSKKFSRKSILDKFKPKSTKLSASIAEESFDNELVEEKKIHPGIMTSIIFAPVVAAWAFTSKNVYRELAVGVSLFLNLFSLKFFDGIADDGLRVFKGAKYVLPVFNLVSALGLMYVEDYIATWYGGLTLACFLTGKLDCWEFQLSALFSGGLYFLRYFSGSFTYGLIDVVAITVGAGLDEALHGVYKKLKKANKKYNQFFEFVLESRLFSVMTLVPYFLLRGHHMVAPLMVFQGAGYEIGGYIVEKMLEKQNKADAK